MRTAIEEPVVVIYRVELILLSCASLGDVNNGAGSSATCAITEDAPLGSKEAAFPLHVQGSIGVRMVPIAPGLHKPQTCINESHEPVLDEHVSGQLRPALALWTPKGHDRFLPPSTGLCRKR